MSWVINETSTNELFSSAIPPMGISQSIEVLNGNAVSVLTIAALRKYNVTMVTCEASFVAPNFELKVYNASAVLLIRGE